MNTVSTQGTSIYTVGSRFFVGGFLALSALFFLTACTFYTLKGGGPVKRELAFQIFGRQPREMPEELRKKSADFYYATDWESVPEKDLFVVGKTWKLKEKKHSLWEGTAFLGYVPYEGIVVARSGAYSERAYYTGCSSWLLFPPTWLWWRMRESSFLMETGEEISDVSYNGLGPAGILGGHGRYVAPTASRSTLEYDAKWEYHLLGGLLAWGRVNQRYYLQLFWIPVSVGSYHSEAVLK